MCEQPLYPYSVYMETKDGTVYYVARSLWFYNCLGIGETVAEAVESLSAEERIFMRKS